MTTFTIDIIPASIEQMPIVKQLLELYTYEMTDLVDFDIKENGYFGYDELPLYWKEPSRYPYLIYANKKLAGFVLIQQGSPIENDPEIWDVTEFFIMRKFRNKDIGYFVAKHLWSSIKGRWQVRVWDNNTIAHAFWENVIMKFINKRIIPTKREHKGYDGLLVYKFNSV